MTKEKGRWRRTGLVRSVVPPFPTRIASLDSRGSPVPFANPLKTTKKGAAAPPSLDFPRSSVCAEIISDLQNAIQMRIWQTDEVIEILCGKVGRTEASAPTSLLILETLRIPYVKYSTGAKKRFARPIVRLGNPILRPPEGRFDDGNETTKRKTERQAFQARKRYFVLQRLFFAYFFLTSQKKVCRRRHSAPVGAEK